MLARLSLLLGLMLGASASLAQTPPPAVPAEPPAPSAAEGPSTLDRYQDCFQKMIDAGSNDNAFMKKCLGLSERPAPKKGPNGEAPFLTKTDVAEVVERSLPALGECYDKLLVQGKDLGVTPEGNVDPRFDVLTDGAVDAVAFEPTSMTDVGLLGCIRQKMKAWTFPKSNYGEKLAVRLSLRLHVAGSGKTAKGQISVAKGFPKLNGPGYGLAPEEVLAVFRKNVAKVRQCYDDLVKKKPGETGKAAVDLVVSTQGRVTKVVYRELSLGDDAFKTCVTGQLKKWKFPKPRSGEPTTVKYPPFVFAPQ